MRTSLPALIAAALLVAGCAGPPKQKSAPCTRPANLAAYGPEQGDDCGPMAMIGTDRAAALAAVGALSAGDRP